MTIIKSFVSDFGASASPADSSGAIDAWLAYGVAQGATPIQLDMGGLTYHFASTNTLTNGLLNATINGQGATVDSLYIGNKNILINDASHCALIQTAAIGDTAVVLVVPADASKFSVGNWILICGLNLQGGIEVGYPPNWQFFEYRQITAIVGSSIHFTDQLMNEYKSTWPIVGDPAAQGGPASIYVLNDLFDATQNYLGLTVTNAVDGGAVFMAGGRSMTIDGMIFQGIGIAPSIGQNIYITGTNLGNDAEFDKLVSQLTLNACTSGQIQMQSSSIDSITLSGWTSIGTMLGTGRNTVIKNTTIGALRLGPTAYGAGKSLSALNTTITSASSSDIALDPSLVSFSASVFSIAKSDTTHVGRFFAWAVPGQAYYFAFYDGSIHGTDDLGRVTYFRIVDVYETATDFSALTDIGNVLPTPTFLGGQSANQYVAYPAMTITQSSGSGSNLSAFQAPPLNAVGMRLKSKIGQAA